jgi:hypothetical protein
MDITSPSQRKTLSYIYMDTDAYMCRGERGKLSMKMQKSGLMRLFYFRAFCNFKYSNSEHSK